MTSEFLAFVLGAAGVLIAAWVLDNFDAPGAWLYASIIAAAYIVSRGLARAGTRDPNPGHGRRRGWWIRRVAAPAWSSGAHAEPWKAVCSAAVPK